MIPKSTIQKLSISEQNTGSTEVQICFLTNRVMQLSSHLKVHKKDYSSQRGIIKLLGTRKRLLIYLFREDVMRWTKLLNLLETREINK